MRWLARLAFLFVFALPLYGQGYRYDNFVLKPLAAGGVTPVSGALITVCTSAGSGTPCTPKVANIFSDEALTTPITGSGGAGTTNSDSNGNFGFYLGAGSYVVTVTGTGITSYTIKLTIPSSVKNNTIASQFPGADIFAQANAAAASLTAPGIVTIPPGTYGSVTTTLQCVTDITFWAYGVQVTYTGAGKAINCQATARSGVYGMHLLGQQTVNTTGIWLGNSGVGTQTLWNTFQDIVIGPYDGFSGNGFDVGFRADGAGSINGTYYNALRQVASNKNLHQGFLFKATGGAFLNANECDRCSAHSNGGDGFQLDGTAMFMLNNPDSQVNTGWGYNLPGTLTTSGVKIDAADSEGNVAGDFNDGSAANVSSITIVCPTTTSTPVWGGSWATSNNILRVPCSQGTGISAITESNAISAGSFTGGPHITTTANPAQSGLVRLANNETTNGFCGRNSANTNDGCAYWDNEAIGNMLHIAATGGSVGLATPINEFIEIANPGGAAGGFGPCYEDSTMHGIVCNFNSSTWEPLPKTVALTADWTCGTGGTVSTCVAATIIGSGGGVPMTFSLPTGTGNQGATLVCDGVVGQATAVTANQWNLLTATNGATNVTANYSMATAATASAYGAVTDQASTTTTFQIAPSWTLGAITTKMPFHIWARIEGASTSGTVVSLQLVAPTVGDLVTIYRGTSCTVY